VFSILIYKYICYPCAVLNKIACLKYRKYEYKQNRYSDNNEKLIEILKILKV